MRLPLGNALDQERVVESLRGGDKDGALSPPRRSGFIFPVQREVGVARLRRRHVNVRELLLEPPVHPGPGRMAAVSMDRLADDPAVLASEADGLVPAGLDDRFEKEQPSATAGQELEGLL